MSMLILIISALIALAVFFGIFLIFLRARNNQAEIKNRLDRLASPELSEKDELKNIPVAVNKGNHDTVKEIYEEQFMPPGVWDDANYYFARDGVLFFALNSNSGSYATQIEYLKKAIQNTNPEWIIVTMHYSMFSAGPHSDEEKILNLRKVYNEAFSELDVDLVLSGPERTRRS